MTEKEKIHALMNNGNLNLMLKDFTELIGKEALGERTGGYFTSVKLNDGNVSITKKVGTVPEDKKEKYKFLASQEKPERLIRYLPQWHISSYQSRNPESEVVVSPGRIEKWGCWGGAILINKNLIFSFSGFPEFVDEAFVCFLGLKSGLMSKCQFGIIKKKRDNNPYLDIIHKALAKK